MIDYIAGIEVSSYSIEHWHLVFWVLLGLKRLNHRNDHWTFFCGNEYFKHFIVVEVDINLPD